MRGALGLALRTVDRYYLGQEGRGMRQRASGLVVMATLLVLIGCKGDESNPPASGGGGGTSPNTISMSYNAFTPVSITISANTTITWKNNDTVTHTSTSDGGVWNTGDIAPGTSKSFTFTTTGTFPYHCVYHSGMVGTVIVQ